MFAVALACWAIGVVVFIRRQAGSCGRTTVSDLKLGAVFGVSFALLAMLVGSSGKIGGFVRLVRRRWRLGKSV